MPDKMFVIIKVNAKEMEKVGELAEKLKTLKNGEIREVKREPIGFGIEVIKVGALVNEKEEGALERLKKEIDSMKLVEYSEIEAMTLV
ncbi:MAG: elongation factor 1-beta [Candidatus Diapherotrites archaeon]|nr:elongation factor 1-beta [Candidatus Diapherotrites archaeon]